jgi:hypothetical protein
MEPNRKTILPHETNRFYLLWNFAIRLSSFPVKNGGIVEVEKEKPLYNRIALLQLSSPSKRRKQWSIEIHALSACLVGWPFTIRKIA